MWRHTVIGLRHRNGKWLKDLKFMLNIKEYSISYKIMFTRWNENGFFFTNSIFYHLPRAKIIMENAYIIHKLFEYGPHCSLSHHRVAVDGVLLRWWWSDALSRHCHCIIFPPHYRLHSKTLKHCQRI